MTKPLRTQREALEAAKRRRRGPWGKVLVQLMCDHRNPHCVEECTVWAGAVDEVKRLTDLRWEVYHEYRKRFSRNDPMRLTFFRFNGEVRIGGAFEEPYWVPGICRHCRLVFAYWGRWYPAEYCSRSCQRAAASARRNEVRRKPDPDQRQCGHCANWFYPKRSTAKFCSDKCRVYASRRA